MKGYWIIFADSVTDPQAQAEYARLWAPIGERYGARIRRLDSGALLESLGTERVLVVEFDSLALARACYEDPDYGQAKVFATQASRREVIVLEGDLP